MKMRKIDLYKKKLISIDDVLNRLKDGDTIVVGLGGAQPFGFLENLHKIKDKVMGVKIITCLLLKNYEFLKYCGRENSPFILESWYLSDFERKVYNDGRATYIPNNLHRAGIEKILNEKIDYYIGTATPMDDKGFFSLSLSLVYEKEMIENAKYTILEINENLPKTFGDTNVSIENVHFVYENHIPLVEFPYIEPTETEKKIGEYISDLIEDGSTIQLGIGGIPNAITKFIKNKKNLGIHTEMITDGMVDLIEEGVVTNSMKTLWKWKTIGAFALGTKKLYDFINSNISVELHRGSVVNDPYIVRKNEKMVSINTSLMVDLTGQVCSESFGYKQFTGTGGQLDMHRGAQMSKGGKGIIALRSTAKGGEVSTIVPTLPEGSYVTVPRQDVDIIVTEFGVAKLKGKSIRERALSLINISHPDFRDKLIFEAKKLNIL
jgi:acyl-CoA hydrolase